MPSQPDMFREDLRFKVLRMLESRQDCSQRDIAQSLGVSLGGVNYCLRALVEKGHVKIANFRESNNKLRYAYVLTPSGISEKALLTGRFLQRKLQEHAAIMAEIDALLRESIDQRTGPPPADHLSSNPVEEG